MSQSNQTSKLETIDNTPSDKTVESIEVVKIETIQTPDYSYGQSQNTLDYNVAIRNKNTGGNFATGMDFRATASGIGTQYINCGFLPKMVKINTVLAASDGAFSLGTYDGINQNCIYGYNANASYYTGFSYDPRMIKIQGYTGNTTNASMLSVDSTGFTLNFTTMNPRVDFIWEAYG